MKSDRFCTCVALFCIVLSGICHTLNAPYRVVDSGTLAGLVVLLCGFFVNGEGGAAK
jgi:hypothetical protein